jgi:tripartite-type tricarboxylate transporter receptor subunit TctC
LHKVSSAPEFPTIADILPGFETQVFPGIVAPAGTPSDIVAKLNAEIGRIMATQDMKDRLVAQGTEVRNSSPDALLNFLRTEKTRWAQVIEESGISLISARFYVFNEFAGKSHASTYAQLARSYWLV